VFHSLEKPTWLSKKETFKGGFFPLFGNFTKKRFFKLYSANVSPFATSSIYSESAQKTLLENDHSLSGNFLKQFLKII
jgi:hypothetical protein